MKGFLKSQAGIYPLAPKITTIGREGCDFIIQNPSVDFQHAIIELSEPDCCFILKDLNSSQGTYVNDCRVQNAAVRLAIGDWIRFGGQGTVYEFIGEQSYAPPQVGPTNRSSWTPLPVISNPQQTLSGQNETFSHNPSASSALPGLNSSVAVVGSGSNTLPSWVQLPPSGGVPPKPPLMNPSGNTTIRLTSRPMSAGAGGSANTRRGNSQPLVLSPNLQNNNMESPISIPNMYVAPSPPITSRGGVVSGTPRSISNAPFQSKSVDLSSIQDKEQKILHLETELQHMQTVKQDTTNKAQEILQLRQQLDEMQSKMRQLNEENASRQAEVMGLRYQLQQMQQDVVPQAPQQSGEGLSVRITERESFRQELQSTQAQLNSVKRELEKAQRDKQINSGLVSQLQRDLTNKDHTISRLSREIESLKKENSEKDITIAAVQAKFTRIRDGQKGEEEREVREQELMNLRQKLRISENKLQEHVDLVARLREDLSQLKSDEAKQRETIKSLRAEMDQGKTENVDIRRAERMARMDLQEAVKRMERFRSRFMQILFAIASLKVPQEEVSDDQLMDMLRQLSKEHSDMSNRLQTINQQLAMKDEVTGTLQKSLSSLVDKLEQSLNRLIKNGRHWHYLQDELTLLSGVILDPSLSPLKNHLLTEMQQQMNWQKDIEEALQVGGIQSKLSVETSGHHIRQLIKRLDECVGERDQLKSSLQHLNSSHEEEMQHLKEKAQMESQCVTKMAVDKALEEAEARFARQIAELKKIEEERLEQMSLQEKGTLATLHSNIAELQQSLIHKQKDLEEVSREMSRLNQEVELCVKREKVLRDELASAKTQLDNHAVTTSAQLKTVEERCAAEVDSYKEQVRQHAVTICSMEERLNKLTKINKELKHENQKLKKELDELKNAPHCHRKTTNVNNDVTKQNNAQALASPSKSAAEIAALERSIMALRQENSALDSQLREKDNIVVALKKDLQGVKAHLSDMQGELSNAQKNELEGNKKSALAAERELMEAQVALSRMVEGVERNKSQISKLESEREQLQMKNKQLEDRIRDLENKLKQNEKSLEEERSNMSKTIVKWEEDGRIATELSSLGAQCRGERHSQIITQQKEALSEMRQKIRQYELNNSSTSGPGLNATTVQQIALLKREIASLRSQLALKETQNSVTDLSAISAAVAREETAFDATDNNSVAREREQRREEEMRRRETAKNVLNLETERSSHLEAKQALEYSEGTYLQLLRAMAAALELETIQGLRNMAILSHEERERLRTEREQACQILTQRIRILKDKMERKEQLLINYELDMARLKQAEELASRKQIQLDEMIRDLRVKTEETDLLRESLNRTKEMLSQEKRYNAAINQKKPIIVERPVSRENVKYHCVTEDLFDGDGRRKKETEEKMKRKDYEIRTLKHELSVRQRELSVATNKLASLETTIDLNTAYPRP